MSRPRGRGEGASRLHAEALVLGLAAAVLAPGLALAQPAAEPGPTAFFTADKTVATIGETVAFDATRSKGTNLTFRWRFGDDAAFEPGNATAERFFTSRGKHLVTLRVRDAEGREDEATVPILVESTPARRAPKALAYFVADPSRVEIGESVLLDASLSAPSSGAQRIVAYEWRLSTNGTYRPGNATMRHEFLREGKHEVSLRVTDDLGRVGFANNTIIVGSDAPARWGVLWESRALFLRATVLSLQLAAFSIAAGFLLAVFVGLARVSRFPLVHVPATAYVELLRGTPLLVQILIAWLVLPAVGLVLTPLEAGALALTLNTSAYQAEVIRSGIQAIPSGQMEAALSLGMTYPQAMRHVVLPQAFRIVIPPLGNEFIILLKDTSLVSVLGVVELTQAARILSARTFLVLEVWLAVALLYFVMTYSLSLALRALEKRLAIPGLGVPATGH